MPFMSSFSGSFSGGRRSNSIKFGLSKRKRIIAHYSPGNSSSYGGSGATLVDLTNNNYDATIVGSPPFNTDNFLIESGDYISTPSLDADINSSSKGHTLEIWCYPTGDGVVAQYCGQATPNTGDHHSAIEIVSGQVEFGLWNGSAISSSGPTGSINLNSWNQIVLTYDGSHIRGFVNGQKVAKTSASWNLPAASDLHVVFGASTTTNQGDGTDFDGNLGTVRIYDRKLTRSLILRNYKHDLETHSVPTYAVTPVSTSQDEGTALQFNVTTTGVPDGKTIYWTVNHTTTSQSDFQEALFGVTAGSTTISNNSASFNVTSVADSLTEGSETYFVEVRIGTGQTTGLIVATSSTVTVNDTSQNSWDPSTDITTVAWIDASDSSSYTTSGTTLTSVTDKSGTYTMTVGGTPTTGNTQNGLNVFDFDGSNEYLQSTTYSTQVSSGNHWCIGVFRYDGTDSTKNSFWSYETNGSPKRDYAVSSGQSNNTWSGELDLDALSSNRISSIIGDKLEWTGLGGLNRTQWYIIAVFFNKTGNQIGLRFDGRTNSFSPVNDYDNSLSTNQELRLMRNRSSVELNGKMGEFFAVASIPGTSGTDLTHLIKAEGYLAHKWGLAGSLPSSHAYKNSAP